MLKLRYIYEATNEKGEVIARGVSEDVAMAVGCGKNTVSSNADTGHKFRGKISFRQIGQKMVECQTNPNIQKEIAERRLNRANQEILDGLLNGLRLYGNTVVTKNLDWHLDYFREHGFDCKARKVVRSTSKRKKECYYILEVKNARTERESV